MAATKKIIIKCKNSLSKTLDVVLWPRERSFFFGRCICYKLFPSSQQFKVKWNLFSRMQQYVKLLIFYIGSLLLFPSPGKLMIDDRRSSICSFSHVASGIRHVPVTYNVPTDTKRRFLRLFQAFLNRLFRKIRSGLGTTENVLRSWLRTSARRGRAGKLDLNMNLWSPFLTFISVRAPIHPPLWSDSIFKISLWFLLLLILSHSSYFASKRSIRSQS